MEGTKRILSIVMATVMVLSVFAGLAVIPVKANIASTNTTVLNTSIVMGQPIQVKVNVSDPTPDDVTIYAVGTSGDADGQVVTLYTGVLSSGVHTVTLETKDIITKTGTYRIEITSNETATPVVAGNVSVSEPILTVKLNDKTINKDDVSSFVKGHRVYINGTSNAGIKYVKVLDSNGIIKFYATSVNKTTGIGYSVLADDEGRKLSELGTGTYTLEVKDTVGTKVTKTFEVVEAEISLDVPATAVLGNDLKIRGTSTDYNLNITIEIKGPVGE
ncbi:MAG: hypothetical protein H5T47_07290, partial [Archaeoglobi archaeon]|nr:hypothetical protein [Candidatus Mnemosynella bozhongmuii]